MRHPIAAAFAAAVLFALAGCQKPAADAAAIEAELKQNARDWFAAFNAGDLETVVASYAQDAVVMAPGNTAAAGHEAIRAVLGELYDELQDAGLTLALNDGDVVGVSGDLAWHSGGYRVNDAGGAAVDGGNYLATLQNVEGKWLLVRDIWNSDWPPVTPLAEGDAPL